MIFTASLLKDAPELSGVYCLYEKKNEPVYVGLSGNLRQRLSEHFVRKDSSITTGTSAVSLNTDYVTRIAWWLSVDFVDRLVLEAAELVAFEILNPILRSRGNPTTEARNLLTPEFSSKFELLFNEKPSGEIIIPTYQNLITRIEKLESQLSSK